MSDERRLATRAEVDWPAEVSLLDGSKRSVHVINASVGGLQLKADAPLGGAEAVQMRLTLEEEEPVELTLRVVPVWTLRQGDEVLIGARFAALEPSDHECLKRVISQCVAF